MKWREWGEEAFAEARLAGKPLLLALSATWCHACRRMDAETWDVPGVAVAVERATVPVRVDADARPDVYGRYHLGGLPSTALLSAAGEFIRGGTYLSPVALLAFLETGLADWASGRRPAARPARPELPPLAPGALVEAMVARLLRRADLEHGGFGQAPKLPEPESIALLLRHPGPDPRVRRVARLSLDAIAEHLADPVEGGFYRYAAARDWSGPHTEKVAVDQGALIRLLVEAAATLGEPRYLDLARGATRFARRRLADEAGRALASMAADPDHHRPEPGEEDAPAVDRRRFADATAALASAGAAIAVATGQDPGFAFDLPGAAPSGEIPHRLDEGGGPVGLLRDQALGVLAALDCHRASPDPALLRWAERAARWALDHLGDPATGAFRAGPSETRPGLPDMFPLLANGEMALALLRLADEAGQPGFREPAARIIAALGGRALASPAGAAIALAAQRLARHGRAALPGAVY
ncbi:MAG: DUF255 domain-containing protein [Candidatus Rokubacteria bacterium]|nr:DUF255 domain-containing protein [Candidatus Rokubacteria bacterium]